MTLSSHKVYKLDKIFTEEYFYLMLPKPPVLRISNLQDFLSHYKKQIQKQETFEKFLNFNAEQIYTAEFFFGDNQFYRISWNIAKAEAVIIENNVPVVKLELEKVSNSIFEKDINFSHLEIAKQNNKPIIAAFYEPTQELIPIDGNHRVYVRLQENEKTIDAYLLSPRGHMLAMCSALDHLLYMFAHNLNVLGCYVCGEIDYERLERGMYVL